MKSLVCKVIGTLMDLCVDSFLNAACEANNVCEASRFERRISSEIWRTFARQKIYKLLYLCRSFIMGADVYQEEFLPLVNLICL